MRIFSYCANWCLRLLNNWYKTEMRRAHTEKSLDVSVDSDSRTFHSRLAKFFRVCRNTGYLERFDSVTCGHWRRFSERSRKFCLSMTTNTAPSAGVAVSVSLGPVATVLRCLSHYRILTANKNNISDLYSCIWNNCGSTWYGGSNWMHYGIQYATVCCISLMQIEY